MEVAQYISISTMILFIVLLVIAAIARGGGSQQQQRLAHRKLGLVEDRHTKRLPQKNADFSYPKSKVSALMQSPCRPEDNGYFGGTSGVPLVLQYGCEMETSPEADVPAALNVIFELVMDKVLSLSFPEICGFRRHLESGRVTGFHFTKESIDLSVTDVCEPVIKPENNCGIYKGTILVYGQVLGDELVHKIVDTVNEAMLSSLSSLTNKGILRLKVSDELTIPIGGYEREKDYGNGGSLPPGAKAGLVISSLALFVGLVALLVYIRIDRLGDLRMRNKSAMSVRGRFTGWINRISPFSSTDSRTHKDENESLTSSKKVDVSGPSVRFQGGRPAVVEFEPADNEENENHSQSKDLLESSHAEGTAMTARSTRLPDDSSYIAAMSQY